jgi:hypothetical protein
LLALTLSKAAFQGAAPAAIFAFRKSSCARLTSTPG